MSCKWIHAVLAAVLLVVTIWPGIIGDTASWWVTIIIAVLFLIHAFTCKKCCVVDGKSSQGKKKKK